MKGTYSLSLTSEQINTALSRVHNEDFIEKDSLDSTLSEQGAPAESKAIGDRLTEVLGYIASPYDSSKTYKAKDLCSHENQIYICVTDINKPEWFNKDHWTSATLGAALTSITQMEDLITHLITLRGLTAGEFEVIAQSGQARDFFKVGDVIYIPWTDYNVDPAVEYEIPHIIVDFIDAIGEDGYTYETSPVLEWMYATPTSLPFDAVERVAVNEGEVIEAGYYYFEFVDPSYVLLNPQPSVGSAVPAGKTYYKHIWANASSAIRFGLNSYHLSAYRQWLNADVGLNTGWWTAQHDSDCSPTNYVDYAGFLYGYDESWKRVFTRTEVKTKGNTDIFGGEVDIDYDYFFLPAISQIGGPQAYAAITGNTWEYWETILAENYPAAERTAYDAYKIPTYPGDTDPATTRLRSCKIAYVGDTYTMTNEGILNDYGHSSGSYKALPATIILGKKKYRVIVSEDDPQSIASFVDEEGDMPIDLTATIVPVQPGSGDPYPPGGRNLLDSSQVPAESKYINSQTGALTSPGSGLEWRHSTFIPVTAGQVLYFGQENSTATVAGGAFYSSNDGSGYISGYSTSQLASAGNVWTVPEGANYLRHSWSLSVNPNWENTVYITLNTNPHEWMPYSNIRPISGWTECKVTRAGKNLFNPTFADYTANSNYIYMNNVVKEGQIARFTFTDKDTSVDISGCYIGFQVGLSETQSTAKASRWAINNGTIQSNTTNVNGNGIVCPGVFIYPKTEEAFNKLFSRYNIMVELGLTATAYEPYHGNTYSVTFPAAAGTVYGGTPNVTKGTLAVTKANIASYAGETLPGAWISDRDVYAAGTTPTIGAQVVYELAEPIVYHLTPVEIRTLAGQNTIWADTGNIKKLFIGIK